MANPERTPITARLDHHTLEKYENIWFGIAVVMSVLLAVAVFASYISGTTPRIEDEGGGAHHLSGVVNGRISADTIAHKFAGTPFATPGVVNNADGTVDVFVLAHAFQFDPPVVKVPAGKRINFYVTSADVLHGYYVETTNINVTAMPGQVASFSTTFKTPGPVNVICDEYCGTGHHNMINKIIVEAPQ